MCLILILCVGRKSWPGLAYAEVKTVLERSSVWCRPEGGSLRFIYVWEAFAASKLCTVVGRLSRDAHLLCGGCFCGCGYHIALLWKHKESSALSAPSWGCTDSVSLWDRRCFRHNRCPSQSLWAAISSPASACVPCVASSKARERSWLTGHLWLCWKSAGVAPFPWCRGCRSLQIQHMN